MLVGIILSIVFLVLFIAGAVVSGVLTNMLTKTPMIHVDYKKHFIKVGAIALAGVVSFIVASFMIVFLWLKATPDALHIVELAFGALLFSAPLLVAINAFILHYYGRNIPELLDKWLFRIQMIGFTVAFFFFFIWTNGLAPYLSYPLVSGISFTEGFTTPNSGHPNIAFYALCILSGAILVYFLCDHYMYKEYGEHGTLESTFFVAFPAGIVGARIAYVIGNWGKEFDYGRAMTEINGLKIWAPLAIWEGGITILGGAIAGILVGVVWYKWRNRGKSVWIPFDIALPAILIAQAVGRWGNFFNCEVHGMLVDTWKWLPEIVWRNAQYSSTSGFAPEGQMYLPLFFIEAIINMLGYFVLAHVFGRALRKHSEIGDIGFGYIIWYGLTRVILEPLRAPEYQMGEEGYWSWIWSMIFVAAGTLAIVINHFVRAYLRKKNGTYAIKPSFKKTGLISSVAIFAVGAALIATGITLMATNKYEVIVTYNGFNVGLALLVLGISALLCLGISIPMLIDGLKKGSETANA